LFCVFCFEIAKLLRANLPFIASYRARRPQYYFEAKIELPAGIVPFTHLLFTFRHVAVRLKAGGLFSLEAKEDDSKVVGSVDYYSAAIPQNIRIERVFAAL
jgi:hypothetical protein